MCRLIFQVLEGADSALFLFNLSIRPEVPGRVPHHLALYREYECELAYGSRNGLIFSGGFAESTICCRDDLHRNKVNLHSLKIGLACHLLYN
ncbi:MAG: hypothetical protein ACI8PB_005437 [Desulforhopalus sp.]|jgi:hypothetical protein